MFADLKNDFVFRRVFANHPDLTAALLNDLLALEGPERIVSLTLLPPEQAPVVAGAKLSILDLKARDQGGRNFVVEMQMLHLAGFLNRVVYNACKTYVGQLQAGKSYTILRDVLAVSLCDFLIWPNKTDSPLVPLVSRWTMTEEASGAKDLRQVQYAFVELPKVVRDEVPHTAAEQWAWLFKYGEQLEAIPTGLTAAQTQTLHLAEEATFTLGEAEAYRRVFDEIEQARQLAEDARLQGRRDGQETGQREGKEEGRREGKEEGRREGKEEGQREGKEEGLRTVIEDLCEAYGVELTPPRRSQLQAQPLAELQELREHIKRHRAWWPKQNETEPILPSTTA